MAMNILSVVSKVTFGTKFLKLCTRFIMIALKNQETKLKTSENSKQEILNLPQYRRSAYGV